MKLLTVNGYVHNHYLRRLELWCSNTMVSWQSYEYVAQLMKQIDNNAAEPQNHALAALIFST